MIPTSRKLLHFLLKFTLVVWIIASAATLWFDYAEAAPPDKVWVCHYNEDKPWKSKPKKVKASKWALWPNGKGHAGHPLDFLLESKDDPACDFEKPTPEPTPTPTDPPPTPEPTPTDLPPTPTPTDPPPTPTETPPTPTPTDDPPTPTPTPPTPTLEPTDTPTPEPTPTETPEPCGGECDPTPTPTPTNTPDPSERRPEPATGLLWLLTNQIGGVNQHCLIFSDFGPPSVERQGQLCWPDWFSGAWVATNAPCSGPVLDDDTWKCDKYTPWRLSLTNLLQIYARHQERGN